MKLRWADFRRLIEETKRFDGKMNNYLKNCNALPQYVLLQSNVEMALSLFPQTKIVSCIYFESVIYSFNRIQNINCDLWKMRRNEK